MNIKLILIVNGIVIFANLFNLLTNGIVLDLGCLDSKIGCEILFPTLIFVVRNFIGGYLCTCDNHEHGFLVWVLHMVPRVISIIVHRHVAVHLFIKFMDSDMCTKCLSIFSDIVLHKIFIFASASLISLSAYRIWVSYCSSHIFFCSLSPITTLIDCEPSRRDEQFASNPCTKRWDNFFFAIFLYT